ncbi:MAG: zinc-ribbon domain-containing protein [Candidatus Methanofastidiosa archaeon]|nr:zinc-ribbon domain-containing protein [Candidatus Methanofastidiosa archaeon]
MVFCGKCGKDNPSGAKFCENCGSTLDTPVARQTGAVYSSGEWLSHEHAGFLVRFVAYIIDAIILGIIGWIISIPFGTSYSYGYAMDFNSGYNLNPVGTILSGIIGLAYIVYFEGGKGATPGKMVMKLKVIGTDGRMPIGYGTAVIRWIGKIISAVVLLLGYIWILFDAEKQGWHDKIANTFVVKE